MNIVIPTKGRINLQLTLQSLPHELRVQTTLVCPQSEVFWLRTKNPHVMIHPQPDAEMGIAEKRKWIVEQWATITDKIIMLDDDLRFAVRRDDDPALFRKPQPNDILQAFAELDSVLSPDIPHAGFSVRGGGIGEQAQRGGWQTSGKRMMYSLGYHLPTVLANAVFGRIGTHEDMDVCLQLLSKGFPNAVNFSFVVDQKFGSPGGCTNERTVEKNNTDAIKLAELHPGYVRTTFKEYKASVPRVEVVCAWQKCLKDGLLNRQ